MSSKSKSQEQELTVPEPVIEFEDVEGKTKEAILTASKAAYLLKLKDEYSSWRECAGHIKVSSGISCLEYSNGALLLSSIIFIPINKHITISPFTLLHISMSLLSLL